jgi:hypothetical protein
VYHHYIREICEDGSLSIGVEVHIPFSSPSSCSFTRIFWGCDISGYSTPFDCAALQAVVFLQSLYGFIVFDYSYMGMMQQQLLFSSAVESTIITVRVCRHIIT